MTNTRHFPPRPGAPVACDMTTAEDTIDQRLAEYARLFERALVRRERGTDGVEFVFSADAGIRDHVEDLARRESICCPFLEYRVDSAGDEVTYTIANPLAGPERASVDAALELIYALPDDPAAAHSLRKIA